MSESGVGWWNRTTSGRAALSWLVTVLMSVVVLPRLIPVVGAVNSLVFGPSSDGYRI